MTEAKKDKPSFLRRLADHPLLVLASRTWSVVSLTVFLKAVGGVAALTVLGLFIGAVDWLFDSVLLFRWQALVILLFAAVGLLYYFIRLADAVKTRLPGREHTFDMEGIRLAGGNSVSFPEKRAQEYSFTVINESGEDISECYVSLDKSERRMSEDDEWEVEQVKLIDAPFRWSKEGASSSGRLDIEDRDRATFVLGRSTAYSATNVQTKATEWFYQFTLSLHDSEDPSGGFELLVGWFYKLVIAIRAKDKRGTRLPDVSYDLYLRPTSSSGPMGGLDMLGMERRQ